VGSKFDGIVWTCDTQIVCMGGSAPSYTPPPTPPPAAQPATLASSSVAANAAAANNAMNRQAAAYGTDGGGQGVAPSSVTTGKTTLGGIS
jgi:hypothetical protein